MFKCFAKHGRNKVKNRLKFFFAHHPQLNLLKLVIYCRLARQFTEEEDIVVTEDAFHGNLGILIDISPKMHGYVPNYKCKDFVHITPLPMSYNRSKLLAEEPPSDLKGKPGC